MASISIRLLDGRNYAANFPLPFGDEPDLKAAVQQILSRPVVVLHGASGVTFIPATAIASATADETAPAEGSYQVTPE